MLITIENIQYHLQITGKGFPLICLHGFSEDLTTWADIHLDGYTLVMIDMIGHGRSDKPKQEKYYSLPNILAHLQALINQVFRGKHYALLGYSLGGRIALAYALQYPQAIDALILESTTYGLAKKKDRISRQKDDSLLAEKIVDNGLQWFQKYWSELPVFASQKNLPQAVQAQIQKRRLQNTTTGLANTLRICGQGSFPCLKDLISGLNIQTLYICGELDKKYCDMGQEFCRLNPKIRYIPVPNAGHNVHLERDDEFTAIVAAFLNDTNKNI